jgi:hypothetical protein
MGLLPGDKLTAEALDRPLVVLRKTGLPSAGGASAAVFPVPWDVEDEDTTATWHSTSVNNTRITPDVAGWIRFTGTATFVSNVTGRRGCGVRLNGGTVHWGTTFVAGTGNLTVSCTVTLEANGTTDYFEFITYQDSGSTLNLTDASTTRFEAELVRRA